MLLLKILDIGDVVESALIIENSGTLSIESIHNINHQIICRMQLENIGDVVESALIIENSGTLSLESIHNINHQIICRMKLENMLNHSKYLMYNVSNRREIKSFLGKIKHPKFVSAL